MKTRTIKATKYKTQEVFTIDIPITEKCSLRDCGGTPVAALIFTEPYYVAGERVLGKFLLCIDHLLNVKIEQAN
jgi:hypothetical protein